MFFFETVTLLVFLAAFNRPVSTEAADSTTELPTRSIDCFDDKSATPPTRRCFTLIKMAATWDEAQSTCWQRGDRLAVVDNPHIESSIGGVLTSLEDQEVEDDHGYNAWIGGHELTDEKWTWNDGTAFDFERMTSANLTTLFSNQTRDYKNCATLRVSAGRKNVSLVNSMCRSPFKYFLCQQQQQPQQELSGNSSSASVSAVNCSIGDHVGVLVNNACFVVTTTTNLPQQQQQQQDAEDAENEDTATTPSQVSWFKARFSCRSMDPTADLASLDQLVTPDDMAAVVDHVTTRTSVEGGNVWIGLARNPWGWVTDYQPDTKKIVDSSQLDYTDWMQPDQPNKEQQDCLSVGSVDGRYGWADDRCDTRTPFICETRSEIPATTTAATTTVAVNSSAAAAGGEDLNSTDVGQSLSETLLSETENFTETNSSKPGDAIEDANWTNLIAAVIICAVVALAALVIFIGICCYIGVKRKGYIQHE